MNIIKAPRIITGLNNNQVAYPIGVNKDSYCIFSYFTQVVETQVISVEHKVIKNWSREATELFTGTASECYAFIANIVEQEAKLGIWVRDEKYKKEEYIPTR